EMIDPENAGTVLRLLLGTAALSPVPVTFDTEHHKDSLGKRPNADLLDALRQLGAEVQARGGAGMLPITIHGGKERIKGHAAGRRRLGETLPDDSVPISVSGEVSSQFLSSLLFATPLLDENLTLLVPGELKSKPLIETTLAVMREAGITVESSMDLRRHRIAAGQCYLPREWHVNGDWPGSAAILGAAAAVPDSEIRIPRLRRDDQGEQRCADFYRDLGCDVRFEGEGTRSEQVSLRSPATPLTGARIDGDLCTDAVLAMMGAAMCAAGESRFRGIRNLQFKECDRVREPIAELRAILATNGVDSEAATRLVRWEPDDDPDTIVITGSPGGFEGGIEVDGRRDHRVIMMLSIVGLRCRRGLRIRGAEHVSKSFPGWFDVLRALGATVRLA
ncbi:3-phosphoshikimate 1-carboxyvinyltransferase, partial [Candidatus Poribacteria bacterium]|nr:3-phosphoshikimate 1-carboxyvinyltransferase [Candidatus Poribacteria bacterium]